MCHKRLSWPCLSLTHNDINWAKPSKVKVRRAFGSLGSMSLRTPSLVDLLPVSTLYQVEIHVTKQKEDFRFTFRIQNAYLNSIHSN